MFNDEFYRFELVKDGWQVLDQFNFILPPQEMSYQGGYRGTLVKTFGGTHIDLDRMDNVQITITGTTGGARVRQGWGKRLAQGSGVDMLKYFRDNIWRYPEHQRYSKYKEKLLVRFWDIELGESYWVYITNFTYRKSREKPVGGWYDFTINMTTVDPPTSLLEAGRFFQALRNYKDRIRGALTGLQEAVDELDAAAQKVSEYLDAGLGFADTSFELMTTTYAEVALVLTFLSDTTTDIFDRVRKSLPRLQSFAESLASVADESRFIFEGEYAESLEKRWNDLATTTSKTIFDFRQAVQTNQRVTEVGTITAVREAAAGTSSDDSADFGTFTSVYAREGGDVTEEDSALGDTGDRRWQRPSHYLTIVVQQGQTLADIAEAHYGDAQLVSSIVEYNELETSDLESGQKIRVPLFQEEASLFDNLVFDRSGEQYGKDVALDHQGYLLVSSTGALAATNGIETIRQTLQNALRFATGDLKSDKNFGFPKESTIGMPGTANARALVVARVQDLIEQDPRVTEFVPTEASIDNDVINVGGETVLAEGLTQHLTFYLK